AFQAAPRSTRSDFQRYYHAGRAVLDDGDIYAARGRLQFKYFPVFAQCMAPFAALPKPVAAYAWYAVIAASYAGMLWVTLRFALDGAPDRDRQRLALPVAVTALLISGRFFVDNARLGQINIPVAFLAYIGAYHALRSRERLGGWFTAWAACLKFMPAVLLLWFGWRRRWIAAVHGVAAVLVFLFVVPAFTWGWNDNIDRLKGYIDRRSKMVETVPKHDAPGQSVPALLNRFLRPVRASSLNEAEKRVYSVNVASLSRTTVNRIALGAVLVLVLLAAWRTGPFRSKEVDGMGAELGVVLVLMLLISPEARRAHFVTLMLPAGVLAARALAAPSRRRTEVAALVAALALTLGTSSDLIGEAASSYAAAYGCVGVAAALLGAALFRSGRTPELRTYASDIPLIARTAPPDPRGTATASDTDASGAKGALTGPDAGDDGAEPGPSGNAAGGGHAAP
ncbi:MAG: glycosyltransferase family 87 protein, partial [Planctomycetota bacterium]